VRELVDSLLRDQCLSVEDGLAEVVAVDQPPNSLAAAIEARLAFLSDQSIAVLRCAASLPPEFSIEHLRIVTGRSATELMHVVEEAVNAGVLADAGPRMAFRHGLIRQALHDGMPLALQAALHRQAAGALARAGVAAELVAEQLLAAPEIADEWMVGWVAESAHVLTYRAPQIAVELLRRTRELVAADDSRREQLDASLVMTLSLAGRHEEEVERLAHPVLLSTRDPEVAGRMSWALASALMATGRYDEALTVTGDTLERGMLDAVWTTRMRTVRARIESATGRYAQAQADAALAEREGRQVGDRLAVGWALHTLSIVEADHQRDPAAFLKRIEQALSAIGDTPETTDLRLLLLGNRSVALANLGRFDESDRAVGHALDEAERAAMPRRVALIRLMAAEGHFYAGRWDDALAELGAAADWEYNVTMGLDLNGLAALIAFHRDDRTTVANQHEIQPLLSAAGEQRYHARYLLVAWALAAERDGQPGEALARLRAVYDLGSDADFSQLFAGNYLWLPDVVRLAREAGDSALAGAATEACLAEASRQPLPETVAVASYCRGLQEGDPTLLYEAAERFDRIRFPLYQAQALENAAVLLAERGEIRTARPAYAQSVEVYSGLGAAWDIRRIDTRLRPLGVRRGFHSRRRQRPTTGWHALSPTELKVASLVAVGRSNPDIAAELWLSRRTVQSHVSHILTKLDAKSRIDIVREVLRRQADAGNE
jgi:DNA-binding CsgD family transcriptional regulator